MALNNFIKSNRRKGKSTNATTDYAYLWTASPLKPMGQLTQAEKNALKRTGRCWDCRKRGHIRSNCPNNGAKPKMMQLAWTKRTNTKNIVPAKEMDNGTSGSSGNTGLLSLPNELLSRIAEFLKKRHQLLALATCNSRLRDVAERELWTHIRVHARGYSGLTRVLAKLFANPKLFLQIKSVLVPGFEPRRRPSSPKPPAPQVKNIGEFNAHASRAIQSLGDLDSTETVLVGPFRSNPKFTKELWISNIGQQQDDILLALLLASAPNLEALRLGYDKSLPWTMALVQAATRGFKVFSKLKSVSITLAIHTQFRDLVYGLPSLTNLDISNWCHLPQGIPPPLAVLPTESLRTVTVRGSSEIMLAVDLFQRSPGLTEVKFLPRTDDTQFALVRGGQAPDIELAALMTSLEPSQGSLERFHFTSNPLPEQRNAPAVSSLVSFVKLQHLKIAARFLLGDDYMAQNIATVLPQSIETVHFRLGNGWGRIRLPLDVFDDRLCSQLKSVLAKRAQGWFKQLRIVMLHFPRARDLFWSTQLESCNCVATFLLKVHDLIHDFLQAGILLDYEWLDVDAWFEEYEGRRYHRITGDSIY